MKNSTRHLLIGCLWIILGILASFSRTPDVYNTFLLAGIIYLCTGNILEELEDKK